MSDGIKVDRIALEGIPIPSTVSVDATYTGDDADFDGTPGEGGQDQWKQPCRCATTASVTISTALNAGDSIDGVTLVAGDRVLVAYQATASQNGIYVAGSTPDRAADMDEDDEVLGAVVYVIDGTANAGTIWTVINDAATVVGTDDIDWAQLSAGGGGGVTSIAKSGDTPLTGAVTLSEGTNVTLTQVGNDIEIAATGGGGGLALSYLGYNTVGGSNAAIGSLGATGYGKKITLSGTSTIMSISAHIAMASLAGTVPWAAVYADDGGSPSAPVGPPLAVSYHGAIASGGIVWTTPTTGGWLALPIGEQFAAGDYWIVFGLTYQATSWRIYYDGSGSDKEITFTDGGYVEGITYRASLASAGNKYSIRALVLA